VCPNVEHRIYVLHFYANFRDDGNWRLLLKDLLWIAAASYTKNDFYAAMEELKGICMKVDPSTWCRG